MPSTNLFIFQLLFFSILTISGCFVEPKPKVFFANLSEGDIVSSPLQVEFGIKGYRLKPAGELKNKTGHHHLLINEGSILEGTAIPSDKKHLHFGNGQTETELDLDPGKYILTLQLGDGMHQSYGENLSSSINIIVK
jgi:hypothetical protein